MAAVAIGVVFGLSAVGYSWAITRIPGIAEQLAPMTRDVAAHPEQRLYILVMAVGMAPIAEEYLFRGLLFRALDREWGGWRAIVGRALFFAVYHPPFAWLPVGLMGVVLASLFKASGALWPCVIVHAAYNLVMTAAS